MYYTATYRSPLGEIFLVQEGDALVGSYFAGQKFFAHRIRGPQERKDTPLLLQAKAWLDGYFAGSISPVPFPLAPQGTAFQQLVWSHLRQIPYGETVTYGALAQKLGKGSRAAQAVGNAVGHNPLSLFIPCHRVVGAKGQLVGYAGGLARKEFLLQLEKD